MAGKTRRVKRTGGATVEDEALFAAIRSKNLAGVKAALDAGAWVDSPASGLGSPLQAAMYSRSPEGLDIARELINRGADINLYRKGTTPLHVAARIRNKEMVKLLLEKGANLNIQDEFRRTASDIMKEQQQRIAQRQAVAVTGAHPESTMPNPDVASMVGKFLGGKRKTRKQKRKTGKRKTRK